MKRNRIRNANLARGPMLLAFLLAVVMSSFAGTLESYKTRIESARQAAVTLEDATRKTDGDNSKRRAFITQVRKDFPASERIEWRGGIVEASNDWLLDRTKSIESETDPQKRLSVVIEVREYLSSIAYKLEELEQAGEAESRTKDEDKQKLGEILRRDEYQKPQQKDESLFQRLLREFLEWLESLFPKPVEPSQSFAGLGTIGRVLEIVLYAGLIGLLLFLVYKLVRLFFPALSRKRKAKKKKDRVILGERLAENETASDLFGEAERLARQGDLRAAIRKGYIALLCDLSDRRVIGLARSKTNRDYLRDVRNRSDLYPRMQLVTDTFERHWYGGQESAESDWSHFRDQYQDAIRSV